jgi:hypothetical protein
MINSGVLITAAAITLGWLYTARRTRSLSRKQHTFNALLQASFNERFTDALMTVRPYLKGDKKIQIPLAADHEDTTTIVFALDHYEFISAGIRNGDIHERLFKDSDRIIVVLLYEAFENHIYASRDRPGKEAVYEHLEWLYARWKKKPPGRVQLALEFCIGRPLPGARNKIKE